MGSTDTAVAEPQQQPEEDGAPVEEGAEATRSARHLFAHNRAIHAGAGATECEHKDDGKCKDPDHFHAWVSLPNSMQHHDIFEKARAAKARKRRALRDAGTDGRQPSDAYVTLESDLDDLLSGDIEPVIDEIAVRKVKKALPERVAYVREHDERFENYAQDSEEWRRLKAMSEEERPTEEFEQLDRDMDAFEAAVQARGEQEAETERAALRNMDASELREVVRKARIDGESGEAHMVAYYLWMAFISTRKMPGHRVAGRYFATIEELRAAAPEVVDVIDETLRDLEGRLTRGDAAGN